MGILDDDERLANLIANAHAIDQDNSLLENEDFVNGFLKDAWEAFEEDLNSRDNADYEINPDQMQHLVRAYRFFIKKAHEFDGKIDPFVYNPKEVVGYLTAHFSYLYFDQMDVIEFAEITVYASAIDFSPSLDGTFDISMTFPDVYRKKQQ